MDTWNSIPTAKVVGVNISLMSTEDVRKMGGTRQVTSHSYWDKSKLDTIYDPRMGPSSLTTKCTTCNSFGCVGHFGVIELNRPCYSPLQINTSCWCSSASARAAAGS